MANTTEVGTDLPRIPLIVLGVVGVRVYWACPKVHCFWVHFYYLWSLTHISLHKSPWESLLGKHS